MTKNWLVEKYVGNWDGYAGMTPDPTHPNNYYLYSDATGKFSMMPWGTDQTWQSWHRMAFDSGGGVLFSQCMADTAGCQQQYLAAGREALTALNAPELDDLARCTAAALRPWQEYEVATSEPEKLPDPSADGEETLEAAEDEAGETRKFIGLRPKELAAYLGEPTPTAVPTGASCPPLRPIGGFPVPRPEEEKVTPGTTGSDAGAGTSSSTPSASTPAPPSSSPVDPVLKLGRREATGRSIAMTLGVPGPGRLTVEGKAGRPAWTACKGGTNVTAAGSAEVTCRLTDRFAALLHERWRRVRIDLRFDPAVGPPELLRQPIRLRRH